jgi:SAM-dependent methyltransferase
MNYLSYYSSINAHNILQHTGDLANARKVYLSKKNRNLHYLLEHRFTWMNKFINQDSIGVEVGSGIASSKDFLVAKSFLTTDFCASQWLDVKNVNALNMPFMDSSKDFVVASNIIHHLAHPTDFLNEASRVLKPNGILIIQEIYTSIFMRLILKLMHHEGYNELINVFDKDLMCNDPSDPWSANCSIPKLLFEKENFEKNFTGWKIIHEKKVEFFGFLNSGGVTAKTFYIKMPFLMLKLIRALDNILIFCSPGIFALQMQIVVKKI